jgi:hypothetical protein
VSAEIEIRVSAWSGNVKPFQAVAYVDGKRIACSGFCKTAERARVAAERAARRALAKVSK